MRYGTRGKGGLEESYFDARGKGFGTEVKRRIMLGTFVLSAGYYDAYYKKALAVRTALRAELDDVFTRVDVLVGPTSPNVAWNMGEKFNDPIAMYLADIFTVSANIAGTPGILSRAAWHMTCRWVCSSLRAQCKTTRHSQPPLRTRR